MAKSSKKENKYIQKSNIFENLKFEHKFVALGILTLFSIYTFYLSGKFGFISILKSILVGTFGSAVFIIPIMLGVYTYYMFKRKELFFNSRRVLFVSLGIMAFTILISVVFNGGKVSASAVFSNGYKSNAYFCTGFLATLIANLFIKIVGQGISIILFSIFTIVAFFLSGGKSFADIKDQAKESVEKLTKVENDADYKDKYQTKNLRIIENEKKFTKIQNIKQSKVEVEEEEYEDYLEETVEDYEDDVVDDEVDSLTEIDEEEVEPMHEEELSEEYKRYLNHKKKMREKAINEALGEKFSQKHINKNILKKSRQTNSNQNRKQRPPKTFKLEPKTSEDTGQKLSFNREIFENRDRDIKLVEVERQRTQRDVSALVDEDRTAFAQGYNGNNQYQENSTDSFLEQYINSENPLRWVQNEDNREEIVYKNSQDILAENQIHNSENIETADTSSEDINKISEEDYLAKKAILDQVYKKVKNEIIAYYNDSTKDAFDFKRKPRVNQDDALVEPSIEETVNNQETQTTQGFSIPNFTVVDPSPSQRQEVVQPRSNFNFNRVASEVTTDLTRGVTQYGVVSPSVEADLVEERENVQRLDLAKIRAQREKVDFDDVSSEITEEIKEEIKVEVKEKILKEMADGILERMSQEDKEDFLISLNKEQRNSNRATTDVSNNVNNNPSQNNSPSASVNPNPNVNVSASISINNTPSTGNDYKYTTSQQSQDTLVDKVVDNQLVDTMLNSQEKLVDKNLDKVVDVEQNLSYNDSRVEKDNDSLIKNEQIQSELVEDFEIYDEVFENQLDDEFNDEFEHDVYVDEEFDEDFDLDEIEQEYLQLAEQAIKHSTPVPEKKSGLVHIDTVATRNKPYVFPDIDILAKNTSPSTKMSDEEVIANSDLLETTLDSFGVKAKVLNVTQGPTVTRYEIQPGVGVKVSKIVNLTDDLALNLAAQGIRIQAPIPGKSAVGIEVPNKNRESIYFREILENDEFLNHKSKIAITLGKDIAGKPVVADIATMPHVLVAGATGSGKSVCINTLITSILYRAKPEECKLLMIDPKVVELSIYNGIPHLMIPVVTDPKKASAALQWAVSEMEKRYEYFAESSVRDLKGYNEYVKENNLGETLPQVVIIVDELADLMMTAGKEVEEAICRLAQKARAAGIHLVIATQRPSVDVITGLIKANIPSRIAFSVTSSIDSRTILDSVGAEKLLGRGDMLFSPYGTNEPIRVQGAFISDKEVENIVNHLKANSIVTYDESIIDAISSPSGATQGISGDDSDDLLNEAMEFFIETGKASASKLQTKFRIGYNRAARIVDLLESAGYIGEMDGSKGRKILITMEEWNEILRNS